MKNSLNTNLIAMLLLLSFSGCSLFSDSLDEKLEGEYLCEFTVLSVSDTGNCTLSVSSEGEDMVSFLINFPITNDSISIDSIIVFEKGSEISFEREADQAIFDLSGDFSNNMIVFEINDPVDNVRFIGDKLN